MGASIYRGDHFPIVRDVFRDIYRDVVEFGGDPILGYNPLVYLNASRGLYIAGGSPAGYNDGIALAEDQSGNSNDFTQTTAASEPTYLPYEGVKYAHLDGVGGSILRSEDAETWFPTGDFELDCVFDANDWQEAGSHQIINVRDSDEAGLGFFYQEGSMFFNRTPSGGSNEFYGFGAITFSGKMFFRLEFELDNGSSQCEARLYTSTDGQSWSLYSTQTKPTSAATSLDAGQTFLRVGSNTDTGGSLASGRFYSASIKDGIGGTTVFDLDIDRDATDNATSFNASTSQPVTVNGGAQIVGGSRMEFDGVDDFMETSYLPEIAHGTPFSVAMRFNLQSPVGSKALWANYDGTANGVKLNLNPNRGLQIHRKVSTVSTFEDRSLGADAGWATLTVVHDGIDYMFYRNSNLLAGSGNNAPVLGGLDSTERFTICSKDDGASNYGGSVAKFVAFDRALTPEEIAELSNLLM